ncbi:MAG: DUF3108 domain-containing protein [Rhodomicrobium sp.]
MAKRPLLRGDWVNPVAATLLSLALSTHLYATRAFGEGNDAAQSAAASDDAKPAEQAPEESKEPAVEAAEPNEAKPQAPQADSSAAPAKPDSDPSATREITIAEPTDSKPQTSEAESKPAPAKPDSDAPAKPEGAAAKPKDAKPQTPVAESKPAPAKSDSDAPVKPEGAAAAEPKDAKPQTPVAESKPAPAKPAEASPPAKPAEPKQTKTEKPKDLSPKPDEAGDLAVRASTVDAVYQISWLGTHVGDFRIKSAITTRQYSLQASAELSVFFGTFSWQGATTSSGLMTANGPVPQNYTFKYATNDKRESVELKFQKRMVQDILINPPQFPGARHVPITAAHLQNVVDPLSAIVLLSQARLSHGEACNKRLPIFDGKIRYDLVLSPKGTRAVGTSGKLHGTAYVCSVHFVPIAGHKMGKPGEAEVASGNTGIEVWLVPVPEAGLIVPYYVHVPTPAGTASIVTAKFDVQTPTGRHALAE